MSRSGYSDDCENVGLWRGAVQRATTGYRGQHLLKKLLDALDAMPTKRLIAGAIHDEHGEVCALGALDPTVTTAAVSTQRRADSLSPIATAPMGITAGHSRGTARIFTAVFTDRTSQKKYGNRSRHPVTPLIRKPRHD